MKWITFYYFFLAALLLTSCNLFLYCLGDKQYLKESSQNLGRHLFCNLIGDVQGKSPDATSSSYSVFMYVYVCVRLYVCMWARAHVCVFMEV